VRIFLRLIAISLRVGTGGGPFFAGVKDPDFVLFVQQLAQIGPAPVAKSWPAPVAKNGPPPVPTRNEIAISLRKIRTRN
jgi:hypothetical protein